MCSTACPPVSNESTFQSFGAVELKKILKWYRNNLSEDSSIAAECDWLHFKHAVIKLKDQNQGIPPFDLFSTITSQQESLHLTSISKVLKIMLDISFQSCTQFCERTRFQCGPVYKPLVGRIKACW